MSDSCFRFCEETTLTRNASSFSFLSFSFNFSHYANKFSLYNYISDPAGKPDQNWWYSWDFQSGGSNIHVMTLDSELYYWDYLKATPEQATNYPRMIEAQWNWIVADLTAAYDSGKYDWIIAYAHRPLYCSNIDDIDDCTSDTELLRKGYPTGPNGTYQWGFESALSVRPLDIYFAAHEHSYGTNKHATTTSRNDTHAHTGLWNRYASHPNTFSASSCSFSSLQSVPCRFTMV